MKKWVIYLYLSNIYLRIEKYPTQNCVSYNFTCYKETRKKKDLHEKKTEMPLKDIT